MRAHSSRKVKAMRLTTCRCTRKQEQQNGRDAKSHGRAKVGSSSSRGKSGRQLTARVLVGFVRE